MARQQIHRRELRTQDRERLFVKRTMATLGLSEAAVRQALAGEARSTVRINRLASRDSGSILQELQQLDLALEAIPWAQDAYFISDKAVITQSDLFQGGEIYVQTGSSLIPGIALAPLAGDRILDLCAAPGGKACHAAVLADGKAELWVNDALKPRIKKLREVLAWQHVIPHELTQYPAQYADKFLENNYYDRILLDVQCSGEGRIDLSKPRTSMQFWSLKRVREYSRLQQRMLRSAYKLLKPGGTLVYSTCTIAPEENELPVDQLVRHTDAVIEPFTIKTPEAMTGLTSWEGISLHPSLKGALRIRPSADMEAFFVCKIRKHSQDQIMVLLGYE